MIIDHIENSVYLRYRDENNERVEDVVRDYKPYFYIKSWDWETEFKQVPAKYIHYTNKWKKTNKYRLDFEEGKWVNLQKQPLVKVYYGTPKNRWPVMEYLERQGLEIFQGDVDIKRIYTC